MCLLFCFFLQLYIRGNDFFPAQCLTDDGFHDDSRLGSNCVTNPENCEDGISFSLFYYADYEEEEAELFNQDTDFQREYIVSTGGENGTPGFAIYRKGANLGAVVSTGNLTWELEVVGSAPRKHTWTNIAVRWEKPSVTNEDEYVAALSEQQSKFELGGLELFLNMESYGHVIFPEIWGCTYDEATAQRTCDDPLPDVKEGFNPPQMMLGCHRTKENQDERMHAGGKFDELAVWNRQLNDSELFLFMGGYRE